MNLPVLPTNRWSELGHGGFEDQSERVTRSLRPSGVEIPVGLMIAIEAARWTIVAETFREWEMELIADDEPPTIPSPEHRSALESLIKSGEFISKAWVARGDVPEMEFTLKDFKAMLKSLKETFRADYAPKLDADAKRKLIAAFELCES